MTKNNIVHIQTHNTQQLRLGSPVVWRVLGVELRALELLAESGERLGGRLRQAPR